MPIDCETRQPSGGNVCAPFDAHILDLAVFVLESAQDRLDDPVTD